MEGKLVLLKSSYHFNGDVEIFSVFTTAVYQLTTIAQLSAKQSMLVKCDFTSSLSWVF